MANAGGKSAAALQRQLDAMKRDVDLKQAAILEKEREVQEALAKQYAFAGQLFAEALPGVPTAKRLCKLYAACVGQVIAAHMDEFAAACEAKGLKGIVVESEADIAEPEAPVKSEPEAIAEDSAAEEAVEDSEPASEEDDEDLTGETDD